MIAICWTHKQFEPGGDKMLQTNLPYLRREEEYGNPNGSNGRTLTWSCGCKRKEIPTEMAMRIKEKCCSVHTAIPKKLNRVCSYAFIRMTRDYLENLWKNIINKKNLLPPGNNGACDKIVLQAAREGLLPTEETAWLKDQGDI